MHGTVRRQWPFHCHAPQQRRRAFLQQAFGTGSAKFKTARRIFGVVLSDAQAWQPRELQCQARSMRFSLGEVIVGSEQRLVASLDKILPGVDLLLALPDAEVFNRATAQTIFLTTYRYRVPVVGYSRSLTRAGALVSLYSSPDQIGQQTAEIALKALTSGAVKLPSAHFPRYYAISVNEHVGRSLGLELPSETTLPKRMQEGAERD